MSTIASTILVAEEQDATRAFLADNLTADGYRVLTAPDCAQAIALLATADPDLMLVDVNGATLEFVDAIRSGEGLAGRADPDTPLIVLSRDADRLQRIRVSSAAATTSCANRSPTPSCAPASPRCCAAQSCAAERRCSVRARS
jgi:DNA-binding response OmpR family regulator